MPFDFDTGNGGGGDTPSAFEEYCDIIAVIFTNTESMEDKARRAAFHTQNYYVSVYGFEAKSLGALKEFFSSALTFNRIDTQNIVSDEFVRAVNHAIDQSNIREDLNNDDGPGF